MSSIPISLLPLHSISPLRPSSNPTPTQLHFTLILLRPHSSHIQFHRYSCFFRRTLQHSVLLSLYFLILFKIFINLFNFCKFSSINYIFLIFLICIFYDIFSSRVDIQPFFNSTQDIYSRNCYTCCNLSYSIS